MSGWTFRVRQAPTWRVDLRGVTPSALAGLSAVAVERFQVSDGNARVALGDFFRAEPRDDDALVFDADLSRFDRVGWQQDAGRIVVDGGVGDYAGAAMRGGELRIGGNAGALAACEMAGGRLTISGNVGDFAASTLPGSMDGMRGGTLVVGGSVGDRFGDRMLRGTAVVFGNVGDFLASRMVAGTIAVGGRVGAHPGFGMRRGSLIFAGAAPAIAPTFVPAIADAAVFWQLLSRDLAQHGGGFKDLPTRRIDRHLGDVAVGGKGEIIVVR
jgi:formylmethanofuran dehydrogenase subunit C